MGLILGRSLIDRTSFTFISHITYNLAGGFDCLDDLITKPSRCSKHGLDSINYHVCRKCISTKVKTGALNYNPYNITSFSIVNIEMYLKLDLVRFQPVLCNEVK